MFDVDTLIIEKSNRSTIIIYNDHISTVDMTIYNLIDSLLQKSLSTLESRLLSTKRALNIKKFVPIYINQGLILQPLKSYDAWDLVIVNYCQIKSIYKFENQTKIEFYCGKSIIVNVSYNRLKKYLKNCEKIKQLQYEIEKESIKYGKEKY